MANVLPDQTSKSPYGPTMDKQELELLAAAVQLLDASTARREKGEFNPLIRDILRTDLQRINNIKAKINYLHKNA